MREAKGFGLVEVLVGLGVGWLVLGAAARFTGSVVRSALTEQDRIELQQGMRSTLEYMVREIRLAGSGTSSGGRFIEALPGRITFRGEVDATPSVNTVSYYLDETVVRRKLDGAAGQPLGERIQSLEFGYLVRGSGWQESPCMASYPQITAVSVRMRGHGERAPVLVAVVATREP